MGVAVPMHCRIQIPRCAYTHTLESADRRLVICIYIYLYVCVRGVDWCDKLVAASFLLLLPCSLAAAT